MGMRCELSSIVALEFMVVLEYARNCVKFEIVLKLVMFESPLCVVDIVFVIINNAVGRQSTSTVADDDR